MENPLHGTMSAVKKGAESIKNVASDALGNAMEQMETEREAAEDNRSLALATLFKGVNVALGIGALLRYLDYHRVLRRLGFARRRSVWGTMALVGAGAVAGAGLTIMLSPMSGQDTRRGLARSLRNMGRKGKDLIESAKSEAGELGQGERGNDESGSSRERGGGKRGDKQGEGMREGIRHGAGAPGEGSRPAMGAPEGTPGMSGSTHASRGEAAKP